MAARLTDGQGRGSGLRGAGRAGRVAEQDFLLAAIMFQKHNELGEQR